MNKDEMETNPSTTVPVLGSARGLVPGVLFSDLGGRAGTADWRVRRVHQTSLVVREWRDSERA